MGNKLFSCCWPCERDETAPPETEESSSSNDISNNNSSNNTNSSSSSSSRAEGTHISLHLAEEEVVTESSTIPQRMAGVSSGGTRWSFEALASESERAVARVVAAGSFAQVGILHIAGVKIAVKEMSCWHPLLEGETETYIRREMTMLENCSLHPNVVDMLGHLKTTSRVLMLMPFASTNIDAMIEEEPLSELATQKFTRQLLSALEFIHEQGIAHRDIKPANLLVAEDNLMLADFGIADKIPICGFFDEASGTKSYMAPEILSEDEDEGGIKYGLEVDIWATGVVIHEMLTGCTPFRPGEVEAQNEKEEANIRLGIATFDAALEGTPALDMISKLLVVDATRRLRAAEAAEHEWLGGPQDAASTRAHAAEIISERRTQREESRMRLMGRRRVVRVRRAAPR